MSSAEEQSHREIEETRALVHTGKTRYTLLELSDEYGLQWNAPAPWGSSCSSLVSLCWPWVLMMGTHVHSYRPSNTNLSH